MKPLASSAVHILGGDVGNEVFDGDTGVGFALAFQLFQLLVVGGDVEAVEDCPAQDMLVDKNLNTVKF